MGIRPVIFAAAMIATELLFHVRHRLIGAEISIGRLALGAQHYFGIEMDDAFGAKRKAVPRQRGMAGIAAVKVLAQRFGDAFADALTQGLADLEIPTLVLWGDSDRIADPDYGRAYASAIPLAKFQLLTDTGHAPQQETPDQVLRAIWDSGIPSGPAAQ